MKFRIIVFTDIGGIGKKGRVKDIFQNWILIIEKIEKNSDTKTRTGE